MAVKIGICNEALPGVGVFAPRIAHELGLDGLQIEMGSKLHGYPICQKKIQEYYLDEQQKYGIEYPCIGMSDLDFHSIHSEPGTPMYDYVKEMMKIAVDSASAMKIPTIMVCCFGESLIKTDEELERAAKMIQYVCDFAGDNDITVGVESPLDGKKTRQLIDQIARENVGVFYDSQNYKFDANLDQVSVLEEIYDLLIPVLHVKDGIDMKSTHLLGTGNTRFFEQMEVLRKHKYEGWIISENYYDRAGLRDMNLDWFATLKKDIEILRKEIDW